MKNTFFDNKFDLIVSLGEDCACTSYLRRFNLQNHSYPFDWLTNGHFENRIELVVNNFKDFINKDDLKEMERPKHFPPDSLHKYYENTRTKLYFWHDFSLNIDFDEDYNAVKEKYDRRIKRFYEEIEKSEKVLFVWLSHSSVQDVELIKETYSRFTNKFLGKEIFLLMIENSSDYSVQSLENDHIMIVNQDTVSDDKKHHYDPTMGNKTNNLKVFKKIRLKTTFLEKLNRFAYSAAIFIAGLIPNRGLRQKAKANINMYFYHAKL